MNWRDHIHSDPKILNGKPVIRGTRYSVERVLKLVGAGWSDAQIAEELPGIEPPHIRATAQFAADLIHNEHYFAIHQARAA
jgi:uncharacterized protein (DUF433 family)